MDIKDFLRRIRSEQTELEIMLLKKNNIVVIHALTFDKDKITSSGTGLDLSDIAIKDNELLLAIDKNNLADAVLSYERPKEKDIDNGLYTDSQRIIKLTKNRSGNGRVDFKGAVCEFCEISKRIYSTGSKFQDTPTLPEKCFMNNDGFTDSMDNPFD